MVMSRALKATGCAGCRLSLLRSFTSLAGPSIRIQQPAQRSRCIYQSQRPRLYSQQSDQNAHQTSVNSQGEEVSGLQDDVVDDLKESEDLPVNTQLSSTPWYLQVESPQRALRPLSDRQKVPDLPDNPPPILEPLMQQVSVDLGLDDLTLLDLRNLDPPPALGANLLMLIATTRSEKHLHVSADRFCRWLRTTYKLKPDADGLLGRNELKLKLKRKAKKAKLMGSAVDDSGDDGVRTGWVCVDVGVVDGGNDAEVTSVPENFVGFGRRTEGVRIVVQMLTEEKREEIDLEKLWTGILRRGTPTESEDLEVVPEEDVPYPQIPPVKESQSNTISIRGQSRGLHTARKLNFYQAGSVVAGPSVQELPLSNTSQQESSDSIRRTALYDLASGDYEKVRSDIMYHKQQALNSENDSWRPFLLLILQTHLKSLSIERALEMLGNSDSDRESTPFLRLFYDTVSPVYVSSAEAEMMIWLQCYAREVGHLEYKSSRFLELFHEFEIAGIELSELSYKLLIRGLLTPPIGHNNYQGPPTWALQGVTDVIQTMHDQAFEIISEEMLVDLQELTAPDPIEEVSQHTAMGDLSETFGFLSSPTAPITARFHSLITLLRLPVFREESRMRLMDLYAKRRHWREFWDIFRMAPRANQPQSTSMYAFMWFHVAQTKNQRGVQAVLRTWYDSMLLEQPSIKLDGDVSGGLRACLLVAAGPQLEQDVLDPKKQGEWIAMWRKSVSSV